MYAQSVGWKIHFVLNTLSSSNTYRVANVTALLADVELGPMKSITDYTGNEGEEKALKTYNYNFAGSAIKTVTSFTYTNDALTLSVTNRSANVTGDTKAVILGAKRSETIYTGNEGEEKALKTYNYDFDGIVIKNAYGICGLTPPYYRF